MITRLLITLHNICACVWDRGERKREIPIYWLQLPELPKLYCNYLQNMLSQFCVKGTSQCCALIHWSNDWFANKMRSVNTEFVIYLLSISSIHPPFKDGAKPREDKRCGTIAECQLCTVVMDGCRLMFLCSCSRFTRYINIVNFESSSAFSVLWKHELEFSLGKCIALQLLEVAPDCLDANRSSFMWILGWQAGTDNHLHQADLPGLPLWSLNAFISY